MIVTNQYMLAIAIIEINTKRPKYFVNTTQKRKSISDLFKYKVIISFIWQIIFKYLMLPDLCWMLGIPNFIELIL